MMHDSLVWNESWTCNLSWEGNNPRSLNWDMAWIWSIAWTKRTIFTSSFFKKI